MDYHRIAILALTTLALASCGVCKKQQPTVIVRDSIRTEIRERIVHDTATVEIPVEVEKIVTRDTSSHLENRLAVSDAVVSGGFLFHSLETRGGVIKVPVEVHVTDTLVVEKEAQEKEVIKEVEKPLTWWQRFRIGAFWWLVGLALVGWRRELLWLVKQLIKLF